MDQETNQDTKEWIDATLAGIDRSTIFIDFVDHLLYEKSITGPEELELLKDVVRTGKPSIKKSKPHKNRICFRKYFAQQTITYYVVVEVCPDELVVVTRMPKNGNS